MPFVWQAWKYNSRPKLSNDFYTQSPALVAPWEAGGGVHEGNTRAVRTEPLKVWICRPGRIWTASFLAPDPEMARGQGAFAGYGDFCHCRGGKLSFLPSSFYIDLVIKLT